MGWAKGIKVLAFKPEDESDTQKLHGGRRDLTAACCILTCSHVLQHTQEISGKINEALSPPDHTLAQPYVAATSYLLQIEEL